MLIPRFWAEARVQHRGPDRQITVRRFGWSDESQEQAQGLAESRAQAALERLKAGEKLARRDLKRPYNGAEGVPIREEVVGRYGEVVVTRNSYGARCLNTPNVLFVDVDFYSLPSCRTTLIVIAMLFLGAIGLGWIMSSKLIGIILGILALLFGGPMSTTVHRVIQDARGGPEKIARRQIKRFLSKHPEWSLRLYRTPAGVRILVTHRTFEPSDPAVAECFRALDADPVYVRMCLNQQCFRARVSPKPWRIGISDHLQAGIWPVPPDRLAARNEWIARYEAAAERFASCAFLESFGSGALGPETRHVQKLHDDLCHAVSSFPIA